MKSFYLGQKDESGATQKIYCFELLENNVKVTEVPPRSSQNISVNQARDIWKELISQGFIRIDEKVAIAASARMNQERYDKPGIKMGSTWHHNRYRKDETDPF